MRDSIFHRMKQEKWWTHVLLLVISVILSFTLLNIIFPLALYRPYVKLIIAAAGSITIIVLAYAVYDRNFRRIIPDLKAHWIRNTLLALILTLLIASLALLHLPYHPVAHEFQLKTSSPGFNLLGVGRKIKDGPYQRISWDNLQLEGDWEITGRGVVHVGESPASITYQRIEMVRSSLHYEFSFSLAEDPTSVSITIDGVEHVVDIPAKGGQSPQIYLSTADFPSSSQVWRGVITIFPITAQLSVFILLFFGLSWILAKQQPVPVKVLNSILFVLVFFLFWITLNYQNDLLNFWSFRIIYILIIAVIFLGVPLLLNHWMQKKPSAIPLLLILVLILGAGIRIYWVWMVPTAQVSDFGLFHNWALQLANGETGIRIDRYANFTRVLSLLYRVFPTAAAVESFNIFFSTGTLLCLYLIGKINQQERLGLMAAYWMAIFLPELSMTSIVNTDIPAVFFLVLSVTFASYFAHRKKAHLLILAGAAFAFGYVLRGALLPYVLVLLFPLFMLPMQKLTERLKYGVLLAGSVILVSSILNLGIQQITAPGLEIDEVRYLVWPLLNGTNVEELGRNNPTDRALVSGWADEDVYSKGFKEIGKRIFSQPGRFYNVLKEKYEYQFANAAYGANLAFFDEKSEYFGFQTGWNASIEVVRECFAQVSQFEYLSILLLALIAVLGIDQEKIALWLPVLVILLCAFGAYTFFEVQPRYSRPIMPFLILLAGMVFTRKEILTIDIAS